MRRGFSLTETIIVIVVLGVLAIVVTPRVLSSGAQVGAEAQTLQHYLRYAQRQALAGDQDVVVQLSGNGYSLRWADGQPLTDPVTGGSLTLRALPATVSLSASVGTLRFEHRYGEPYVGGGPLGSAAQLVLVGADARRTVTVVPYTGYVRVE